MTDLRQNRQHCWYSDLKIIGEEPVYDADGYDTGETIPIREEPKEAWLNISPATGDTITQTFGDLPEYSKVIATAREFPFSEETVFWIDRPTDQPHNYKVIRVAKSLNSWLYALERVAVTEAS